MIAALLLAGVCATPLTFTLDGPDCGDPMIECRCSECFQWDDQPAATYYEIKRTTVSSGTIYTVGRLNYQPSYLDDESGEMIPEERPLTWWCAARDFQFPHEGVHYRYKVNACNQYGCTLSATFIDYVAAPYSCWDDGAEVQCYVGDTLVSK